MTAGRSPWFLRPDGKFGHRPRFKVVINTILRFAQTRRRPAPLFVLASIVDETGEQPKILGYRFTRVMHVAE